MTHLRRRHSGFSMLELIIALSMAAMLALSLYTALRVATRARRSAQAALEPARAANIAADLIRQDLESVPPPTGTLAGPFVGLHQPGASGDADTVQFCSIGADSPVQDRPMSEGIRKIELLVRDDLTPPTLVRRITRNLLPSSNPQTEEEILCRDVRAFSIRYYNGVGWQDSWDSTTLGDVLPMAVSYTVELNDPDPAAPSAVPRRVSRVIPLACAKLSDSITEGILAPEATSP